MLSAYHFIFSCSRIYKKSKQKVSRLLPN
ncbi:CLUMA_CG009215, isoform A [Clunio marinus]|uniref:CLUMA_CG009215, isoform A n=1 Tax=Clunio marinus TaxID=568069 RepID=A0A1J1I9W4_9DIPT|nr:CLUMA_CG009215, isoform A [Clunio marinus]